MTKDKKKYLEIVLTAASERADFLEELANECLYATDKAEQYRTLADDIRLAIAELT